MTEARLPYSRALAAFDHEALMATLADDVVIRVAVHDEPLQGKDVADFLFGVLREELDELRITDEIVEGDKAVVLFETSIREMSAQGLNVVEHGDDGRVHGLTVFFRPLAALGVIAEVIGARMQARFGAPG
jgi:ketosteroid isomerase-like protein